MWKFEANFKICLKKFSKKYPRMYPNFEPRFPQILITFISLKAELSASLQRLGKQKLVCDESSSSQTSQNESRSTIHIPDTPQPNIEIDNQVFLPAKF